MAKSTIINQEAYERSIQHKIVQNARITWLRTYGDDAWKILDDATPRTFFAAQMYNAGRESELFFLDKLAYSLDKYGKLSEKQTKAYLDALDKAEARKEARRIEREQHNATLNYVGVVGERSTFELTVSKVTDYLTQSFNHWEGDVMVFVTIMNDVNGNVVVYKGARPLGEEGEKLKVVARVKEHKEYKGQKQTILTRPTVK